MGNSQHRLEGNEYFRRGKYQEAIDEYTKGLDAQEEDSEDPDTIKLLLNRSQAYGALGKWAESEADARKALNFAHNSHKAYYLLGKALAKQGQYNDALQRLHRALSFAVSKEDQQQIQNLILESKRSEWEAKQLERSEQNTLILSALDDCTGLPREHKERIEKLIEEDMKRIGTHPIPSYLVCPINQTLLRDPVILIPSGNTYERHTAEEYMRHAREKHEPLTDPITREPIQPTLVPNHALRDAAQDFMDKNPWAASEWLP